MPVGAISATRAMAAGSVYELWANETLSAVELEHGDQLLFTLLDGSTRRLKVLDSWTRVLLTDLADTHQGRAGSGTMYAFGCRVEVDGRQLDMVRYVPVQASFYEPYVINGVRIWFDAVRSIGEHFNETHGACLPRRAVRLALQDASLPICPEELRPWYPLAQNRLDVHQCYNGDDVWLGPYQGADLHGGLDINMPIGTPLWAPIAFHNHYYFNSLKAGDNNNRWRGERRWENGQRWALQVHHLARLLKPEGSAIAENEHYAVAAGELTGSHAHSHFVFKIGENDREILLDPWILFREIFVNNRRRSAGIRAHMASLGPGFSGEAIWVDGNGSRPGPSGNGLRYYWDFGDGGFQVGAQTYHVFARPGIYPVTLVIDDGTSLAATTQHITISGVPLSEPVLSLASAQELEFLPRPLHIMDTYGDVPQFVPHILRFVARPRSAPRPTAKQLMLQNLGVDDLPQAQIRVDYHDLPDWLSVTSEGTGNQQQLSVAVDASRMKDRHGVYLATVHVDCEGATNSPQQFQVQLTVPAQAAATDVIVDNQSPECYASPYQWHAPRFHGSSWPAGYAGTYLVAGDSIVSNAWIRYQPDLADGTYEVSLHPQTPVRPTPRVTADIRYPVRVRHADGEQIVWLEPLKSLSIGRFKFECGTQGFVQIETAGSSGLVVADAIHFKRVAGD